MATTTLRYAVGPSKDGSIGFTKRRRTLNPNAAAFIPSEEMQAAIEAAVDAITEDEDNYTVMTDLSADKDFRFPVPVAPTPVPAAAATRAFIRIFHNDKELTLSLDYVNGLEMEELEYAIRGLTATITTPPCPAPKPTTKERVPAGLAFFMDAPLAMQKRAQRPTKKFYNVNICCGAQVTGIDDAFKRRFNNPHKKWLLRMGPGGGCGGFIRKWGKVEVSFILH